jgi:hypothetical protein
MKTQKNETSHLTPTLYRNELKEIKDLYVISESMKVPQEVLGGMGGGSTRYRIHGLGLAR